VSFTVLILKPVVTHSAFSQTRIIVYLAGLLILGIFALLSKLIRNRLDHKPDVAGVGTFFFINLTVLFFFSIATLSTVACFLPSFPGIKFLLEKLGP
jgi:hypothetical protein